MRYKVRIDRATLKVNPRWSPFDPGEWRPRSGAVWLVEPGDDEGAAWVRKAAALTADEEGHPTLGGPIARDKLVRTGLPRHVAPLHTFKAALRDGEDLAGALAALPEPKWLYKFEPLTVECRWCPWTGDHSELVEEVVFGDAEGVGAAVCRKCPSCGRLGPCEIEYERPEDVTPW